MSGISPGCVFLALRGFLSPLTGNVRGALRAPGDAALPAAVVLGVPNPPGAGAAAGAAERPPGVGAPEAPEARPGLCFLSVSFRASVGAFAVFKS